MPTSAWCSECKVHVWVTADGGCPQGHPRSCLRALREAPPNAASPAPHSASISQQAASPVPRGADDIASSQKLIIVAIAMNFTSVGIRFAGPGMSLQSAGSSEAMGVALVAMAVGFAAAVLALFGIWRLSTALGSSAPMKVLFMVLMFLPVASLITLLVLNDRATRALREAGYKVGLLGARA